jgi:hypothetical protein
MNFYARNSHTLTLVALVRPTTRPPTVRARQFAVAPAQQRRRPAATVDVLSVVLTSGDNHACERHTCASMRTATVGDAARADDTPPSPPPPPPLSVRANAVRTSLGDQAVISVRSARSRTPCGVDVCGM